MGKIIEMSENGDVKSVKTVIDLDFITSYNSGYEPLDETEDEFCEKAHEKWLIENEKLTIVELTIPQTKFLNLKVKYALFVAGFGAGKSTTMVACVMRDLQISNKVKIACYCPTYDLLSLITAPYLEERLIQANIEYKYNKSTNIFQLATGQQIILRSMDNPARIVGYQTFRAHIDELDTLQTEKAEEAWNKIIARNRQRIPMLDDDGKKILLEEDVIDEKSGVVIAKAGSDKVHENRVSAYSTPEGFRFCYKRWIKESGDDYDYVQAPTHSNPHNPPDYIQSLRDTYPAGLIDAYIEGMFVNLTSGSVYPEFSRELNNTNAVAELGENILVGLDFNVNQMAASICVRRKDEKGNDCLYQIDEISGGRDTETVCEILKDRYGVGHSITVFPDASGRGTSSKSASVSDLAIIKSFGFKIKAKSKNPFIKDRVASVNGMICNGSRLRRFFINVTECPNSTDCLEQQCFDNGMPDKKSGTDHHNDSVGYLIDYLFPVRRTAKMKSSQAPHIQVR